jgi:mercuric reductase
MTVRQTGDLDLVVIGTGAAGMAAAIRGAELGRRVAIVEAGTVGGTCVNVGCIPSKTLIAAAEHYHSSRAGFPGVANVDPAMDWALVQDGKRKLVDSLHEAKYLDVLASYPEITLLRGRARLRGNGVVDVDGEPRRCEKVIVATGTSPWLPAIEGSDSIDVLDSTTVMNLENVPESLIVLGGGAVGLELGQMFARFGTRVTVLELLPRLLATEDDEAAEELRRRLVEEGMDIHTGTRVIRLEGRPGGVIVHAMTQAGERSFEAERLLAATGRRANIKDLGLDEAGVAVDERGFIQVDSHMRTANPAVFAAGDVTGGPGFVYIAAAAGRVAADNALSSMNRALDLSAVPRVTFTSPQVAAVGLTEKEAEERGLGIDVRRLDMAHVPRAIVEYRTSGWIKVVAERTSGRILGVHAVAPNAAELLGEATLAVRLGLTTRQLVDTLHPYLTWVEGLKLAAQTFETDVAKLSCCA